MIKVYYADVSVLKNQAIYESLILELPEYRLRGLECLKQEEDRLRSVGAGALLNLALRKEGLDSSRINIGKTEKGKPYLEGITGLEFNLSHSGKWVMCVISDTSVGCDVERIAASKTKIAKRFFTPAEARFVENEALKGSLAERFFRIWTLKESYIKAVGDGLSLGLKSFSVVNEEATCVLAYVGDYRLYELELDAEYRFSVCAKDNIGQNGLSQITKIAKIDFSVISRGDWLEEEKS